MRADHVFESFNLATGASRSIEESGNTKNINFDCLKTLMTTYDKECDKMDDYSLQYVKYFVAACESTFHITKLVDAVKNSCSH